MCHPSLTEHQEQRLEQCKTKIENQTLTEQQETVAEQPDLPERQRVPLELPGSVSQDQMGSELNLRERAHLLEPGPELSPARAFPLVE